jgi:hypothetical protein
MRAVTGPMEFSTLARSASVLAVAPSTHRSPSVARAGYWLTTSGITGCSRFCWIRQLLRVLDVHHLRRSLMRRA